MCIVGGPPGIWMGTTAVVNIYLSVLVVLILQLIASVVLICKSLWIKVSAKLTKYNIYININSVY